MRKKKWLLVFAPVVVALFVGLCGEVVMHPWNWLLPTLFGWRQISFWQGLGLLVLCRILFGGFGGHGHNRGGWKRRRDERWERMTPEEREKFRKSFRSRCGDFGAPASETQDVV